MSPLVRRKKWELTGLAEDFAPKEIAHPIRRWHGQRNEGFEVAVLGWTPTRQEPRPGIGLTWRMSRRWLWEVASKGTGYTWMVG